MSKRMFVLATLLALLTALSLAPVASSKDGDVRVAGTCSRASSAKLKLSPEDGRIEVELEVDQNRVGVRWRVVLKHGARTFVRSSAVTRAPSGSFELRRLARNRPASMSCRRERRARRSHDHKLGILRLR